MNKGLANRMIKKLMGLICVSVLLLFALFCGYYIVILQEVKSRTGDDLIDNPQILHKFEVHSDSQVYNEDFEDFLNLARVPREQIDEVKKVSKVIKAKRVFDESYEFTIKRSTECEYNCLFLQANFEDISPLLWKGLVGIEDYRFFEHKGVDYKSILRALLVDLKAMKIVQGGSTLTQQLVKNIFLSSEKKISRKFKEMVYASYLEEKFSKDEIVMLYFNHVYWGSFQGVKLKGIEAASIAYFEKKASELTSFESIILIGMLKGPYYYSPYKNLDRLKSRIEVVYKRLENLKLIAKVDKWKNEDWNSWHKGLTKRNKKKTYKSFIKIKYDSNISAYEEYTMLQSVQRVKALMKKSFEGRDIGIKILLDKNEETENYKFYSKTQRDLKKAISEEKHQVASILKPIIYNYFFINGKKPKDLVSTRSITLNLKSGAWTPKDSSKAKVEYVTLEDALKKSKNIPLVRLARDFGFKKIEEYLKKNYVKVLKSPLSEYPAQLLGSVEMTLRDISLAYSKFLTENCSENLFKTETVNILSNSKDSTLRKVASSKFKLLKVFAKTGTSNKAMDNWFVGYDSKELIIIWVGQETKRNSKRLVASGATSSFRIYQDFIFNRGKRINELICK